MKSHSNNSNNSSAARTKYDTYSNYSNYSNYNSYNSRKTKTVPKIDDEQQQLLVNSDHKYLDAEAEAEENGNGGYLEHGGVVVVDELKSPEAANVETTTLADELKLFAQISWPSVLLQLFWFGQWLLTFAVTGRVLGPADLAGSSLASLAGNLSGLAVFIGIVSAQETLGPQCYGLGNYPEVGRIALRNLFICFLFCPFMAAIWWNAEDILTKIGEPSDASEAAGKFLRIHLLGMPAIAMFEVAKRFFAAQNVIWFFVPIAFISIPVHGFCLWLLIDRYGIQGVAVCHVITNWYLILATIAYMKVAQPHHPRTVEIGKWKLVFKFSALLEVFKLAIPGIFSMSEWFYWEVITFVTGRLGDVALAAHSVAYSTVPVNFMLPMGVSLGVNARVGNLLAARRVKMAQKVAKASVALTLLGSIIGATVLDTLRWQIARIFTDDPDVLQKCDEILPLVSIFLIMDSLMGVFSAILRALGMQVRVSVCVLLSLWLVGIPYALYITFGAPDLGLYGVWISMPSIYIVLDILLFLGFYVADWDQISKDIATREARKHAEFKEYLARLEAED